MNIDEMLGYTLEGVFDNITDSDGRLPDPDEPR